VKGVSSLKLHVYERVTFSGKNTIQKGKHNDLGAEPPWALLRSLLPPPEHSYMEKTYITVNKNIHFTLGSNSKTKLDFLVQDVARDFTAEYHFQPSFFK